MLISSTIPNLVNGVSQQPTALRLSSQAEAQDNFVSSVVEGLKRRPSSKFRSKLTSSSWTNAFLHTMNRDSTERYTAVVIGGDLKVFDLLDGTEQTVAFPDGKSYLTGAGPTSFRAVTVADYTFLVNRDITVAMDTPTSPDRLPQALISVVGGNYSRTFKIIVDDVDVAEYETPDGSATADGDKITTVNIATELETDLNANLSGPEWAITRLEGVIHIVNTLGNTFTLRTEDDWNEVYMKGITDVVQNFSDLPSQAPSGFQCEVVGDSSSSFDNYYVEWDAPVGSESTGVWRESLKWDTPLRLDASTMPHILVRESDGTFTFRRADWEDRSVGDEDSSPDPSLVGRKINDVFFFRNRLGFAADENIVMSRSGEFFNFFARTVTTLVDTDPIDVGVSHVKVSTINHAVPFNQNLLLFSSQSQFILSGGNILSPGTVSIDQTTEFEGSPDVRPVGAGPNVYFPVNRGTFTGVREYYVEDDSATNNANDVTSHCPKYIPGDVVKLSGSSNEDVLLALSGQDRGRLYVYKYFFGSEGKLQSSWSCFTHPSATILDASLIETKLYLVVEYSDGVYLEEIDIETGASDEGSAILYRMDRKVYESDLPSSPSFDGTHTIFVLPYATDDDLWVIIRAGDAALPEGYVLTHTRPTSTQVQVKGDHTASKVAIGVKYMSTYEFSPFTIKEEAVGGGQASIGAGRLQIMHLSLEFDRSGYFEVHVTPLYRDTYVYKFTGHILGSGNNIIGQSGIETGRFKIPVLSRNTQVKIEIKTDSFLPSAFMSAEWEGRYDTRSRRL